MGRLRESVSWIRRVTRWVDLAPGTRHEKIEQYIGHWDTSEKVNAFGRWNAVWEFLAIRRSLEHDMKLWVHVAAGTRPRMVEAPHQSLGHDVQRSGCKRLWRHDFGYRVP